MRRDLDLPHLGSKGELFGKFDFAKSHPLDKGAVRLAAELYKEEESGSSGNASADLS